MRKKRRLLEGKNNIFALQKLKKIFFYIYIIVWPMEGKLTPKIILLSYNSM